jgi:hypothetical protein
MDIPTPTSTPTDPTRTDPAPTGSDPIDGFSSWAPCLPNDPAPSPAAPTIDATSPDRPGTHQIEPARQPPEPADPARDRGQATTEYALVLLAAALVGLLVIAWATAGGGAARIARLFNAVIDSVIDKV